MGSGSAGDGSCHTITFASWNLAGWHGSSAKLDLLKSIDADIIGLVETHLHGEQSINIPEFTWIGHNRVNVHRNAILGSGG